MTQTTGWAQHSASWRRRGFAAALLLAAAPPVLAAGGGFPYVVWRLDVGAVGWALAAAVAYTVLWAGLAKRPGWHLPALFAGGLASTVLALSSPLDSMGETVLLTMHMLEHMALALVGAILLVAGIPRAMLERVRRLPVLGALLDRFWNVTGMLLFNVVMVAWHVPALYEAALRNEPVHDLEHLCFLVFGMLFWGPILRPLEPDRTRPGNLVRRIVAVMVALGVNTALGSYLFFVQNVLYPTYLAAPRVWGLIDVRTDQSIAGGTLWSMGDMAYIVAGLVLVVQWLQAQADAAPEPTPAAD